MSIQYPWSQCGECGEFKVRLDIDTGEEVCHNCGLVHAQVEYEYEPADGEKYYRSPMNLVLFNKGLGTVAFDRQVYELVKAGVLKHNLKVAKWISAKEQKYNIYEYVLGRVSELSQRHNISMARNNEAMKEVLKELKRIRDLNGDAVVNLYKKLVGIGNGHEQTKSPMLTVA